MKQQSWRLLVVVLTCKTFGKEQKKKIIIIKYEYIKKGEQLINNKGTILYD